MNIAYYQDVQIFFSTIVAVFLEASPFLLLGALLSSVFEIYMPQDLLEKYLPKDYFLGLLFGLFAGMLVPTCECGVVFIARRLLKKNVPAHVAMTYLFSAPVINPLVLAATYVAFRGNMRMVVARVFVVAVCACILGSVIGQINPGVLLREEKDPADPVDRRHPGRSPVSRPDPFSCALPAGAHACASHCEVNRESGVTALLLHTASEFLDMGKYLILGAVAVGVFKLLMLAELMLPFQSNIYMAVGALMLLAVFLSICSEADAFVAASFISFPTAAQLSFMALGPMVDLKLIFMYGSVFRKRIALMMVFFPIICVFILSLMIGPAIR
jgi:uncharacterized membrane protein YraQ (UPF0718 family)